VRFNCLPFVSHQQAASRTPHTSCHLPQVAKECVAALAAAARSGPDSIKDAAQLALTECTDDVCQGERRIAAAVAHLCENG